MINLILYLLCSKRGHNVFSIAPRFDQYADAWDSSITIPVDGEEVGFFHTIKNGVQRVWIDHPWFLAKVWGTTGSKLYGKASGADFVDNQKRFSLFCKAALEALEALPFMPGQDVVLVANDWHTALIPVLIKDVHQPAGRFLDTKVAYCIHNVAFQGRFWPESFAELGLPESSRERFAFEDGYPKVFDETTSASEPVAAPGQRFAKLNWLRAGVTACDKLLTVSPNYAVEMTSGPQLGVELHEVLAAKGIEGIVNGMDVGDWNPALDKFLSFKYNADGIDAGKGYAKTALQREAGLPVDPSIPVFGFIGRLEEQKGVDILLAAIERLPAGTNAQVVVLGTGKASLEAEVRNLANRFPGVAAGVAQFNNAVAHLITAGADYMVVPSRFEPCGLIQLHAMAYGTVPLVASTGGLVDTVSEGVTGFQMGAMDPDGLLPEDADSVAETMARAAEVYGTPAYTAMRDACIAQDLSWAVPARKWEAVLEELKFGQAVATEAAVAKAAVPTPVAKLANPTAFPDAPGPKPADVAAAAAAPKLGAAAPAVTPAAAAAATVFAPKPAVPAVTTQAAPQSAAPAVSAPISRAAAATAAKASFGVAPAPIPPAAATTKPTVGAAAPAAPAATKAASIDASSKTATKTQTPETASPAAAPTKVTSSVKA